MTTTPATTTTTPSHGATPFPAHGKVTAVKEGLVVFHPTGTNYELQLVTPRYDGPVNTPVDAVVRVTARKVYTVPSGGNFISPLFGPPRTIQGRVRALNDQSMVVQAGCPITVDFPNDNTAFELATGPITVGSLVNVVAQPGARFEKC
jgi:hypothetical protein